MTKSAELWSHRRLSLRLRITAGALIVVVAALSGAGWLWLRALRHEMVAQIDSALNASSDFIVQSMGHGTGLPARDGPSDLYVQFIAPDGRVIASTDAARNLAPLVRTHGGAVDVVTTVHDPTRGDLRVLARPAVPGSKITLAVARSSASVSEVQSSQLRLLLEVVAAGSVLLGALIWVVVGRALRPVDAMRHTVDAIGDRDLSRRVVKPGTGDELDRLAETLNRLLERLEVAITRERQFVADASHELRTPIAGMRALLETQPAEPRSAIGTRADALARLGSLEELVEGLLVLARADEAGSSAAGRSVDLDELVLGMASQLRQTTDLRIETSQVSGGQVYGRDTDLGRLLENLATNAARHARTSVSFSVRQRDGVVEMTVSDDGPGIAPGDRSKVFERFRTLEEARPARNGTSGLGLAIVFSIASAHKGSVHVEDSSDGGARFVVRLPEANGSAGP